MIFNEPDGMKMSKRKNVERVNIKSKVQNIKDIKLKDIDKELLVYQKSLTLT